MHKRLLMVLSLPTIAIGSEYQCYGTARAQDFSDGTYECKLPLAQFAQRRTYTMTCNNPNTPSPLHPTLTGYGICGLPSAFPDCKPEFEQLPLSIDGVTNTVTWSAQAWNVQNLLGRCVRAATNDYTSSTCQLFCVPCITCGSNHVCQQCPAGSCLSCCTNSSGASYPCCKTSPLVIDAWGEGFHLTNIENGVRFALRPGQQLIRISWTDGQYRNAWVVLDRNGNGKVDDATELFGTETPQPESSEPNGYKALAVFDLPANGGNGNGKIDPGDSVFDSLRLWIDRNHNGVSDSGELIPLRLAGVFGIDLGYEERRFVDANGNEFRYQSRVWDRVMHSSPSMYDVMLQAEPLQDQP